MDKKFHLSVTLSAASIDFINSLDGKSFSASLEKVVTSFKSTLPNLQRAEALENLRKSIKTLKDHAPEDAIKSWFKDAMKGK